MFRSRRFPVGAHAGLVLMEITHRMNTSSYGASSASYNQSRAHHRLFNEMNVLKSQDWPDQDLQA